MMERTAYLETQDDIARRRFWQFIPELFNVHEAIAFLNYKELALIDLACDSQKETDSVNGCNPFGQDDGDTTCCYTDIQTIAAFPCELSRRRTSI
jgi:hypothetical protein